MLEIIEDRDEWLGLALLAWSAAEAVKARGATVHPLDMLIALITEDEESD